MPSRYPCRPSGWPAPAGTPRHRPAARRSRSGRARRLGRVGIHRRSRRLGTADLGADEAVELAFADRRDQRVADHAVAAGELGEVAAFERLADDGLAGAVDIGEHDQHFRARRGERADFGAVVGLAVLMCLHRRNLAALFFEGRLQRLSKALAVVVVDIGDGDVVVALGLEKMGEHVTAVSVRRRGAEQKILVLDRGQRRRSRRRRYDHDIAGDCRAVGGGDGLARAERADQRRHLLGIDHAVGGVRGRRRVGAGRIALHHDELAVEDAALLVDLLDRELGAFVDRRDQRLDRAGEAAEEADLDVGRRCRGRGDHGRAGDRRGEDVTNVTHMENLP